MMRYPRNLAFCTLFAGLWLSALSNASAQLTLTLNNASPVPTVAPGGTVTFNATLNNTSTTNIVELLGINVNLAESDVSWGDFSQSQTLFETNFYNNPNKYMAANTARTGNLFRVDLTSSPSQPPAHNYDGTVDVFYRLSSADTVRIASANFKVQSTPTPPVILVTLFSGIGAARMALRRSRKEGEGDRGTGGQTK